MHTTPRTLLAAALALMLTACGTQRAPATITELTAAYYAPPVAGTVPPAFGATMMVFDPLPVEALAPAALARVSEYWKLGPAGAIGPDGSVTVPLPPADDDLEALLVSAPDLLFEGCALAASDPSVLVTPTGFELVTSPGVAVLTSEGWVPGVVTDVALPSFEEADVLGVTFYSFVYATGPVTVTGEGAECISEGETVELELEAGWNWVGWSFTDTEASVRTVPAPAEAYLTMAVP